MFICGLWVVFFFICIFFNVVSDGLEVRLKYKGILYCLVIIWKVDGLRGFY